MATASDQYETRPAARDQTLLPLRAVVGWRIGQDDVANAEAAEPVQIGWPVELVVEHLVLREVVLPEPAASERDIGTGKVDGRPVACRVDDLDSVGRRQSLAQVIDRGLPVGR